MQFNKPLIIRDTREKLFHGWDFPEDNIFKGTILKKLDFGDYSIQGLENLIFIDRKESIFEIGNNIKEKRFHKLIHNIQNFKYKYIICEFTEQSLLEFKPVKIYSKAYALSIPPWKLKLKVLGTTIHKALFTISTKYGISIIYNYDKIMAEKTCYNLLKQIWKLENAAKV